MASSRSRWRPLLWPVIILAALAVVATLVIPEILSWRLESALRESLGGRVSVRVAGVPWRLLAGSFDTLGMEARGIAVNQLPVARLALRLSDARVDLPVLFRENRLVLQSASGGEGAVTLTRENVEQYLAAAKSIQSATVSLEEGLITIEGNVRVGELDLRARLVGRLEIASPTTVDLQVQELTVSGVEIPREVGALLVASINPLINLAGLPVPARISSVAVEGGEATMTVRVDAR
ncbi:MAG TPA: DUF2993 domain-containing protein [bacterium]|jgi:hypothetical protein|nr:DUF2993 domain-containing protein [bacterium]